MVWNKILAAVLKMPGVKIERVAFLRKALKGYCNDQKLEMIESVRPYSLISEKEIDQIANATINAHTAMATAGSTIAGLPGGLAMAATIPGDITQYYFHVIVLVQKLAYLYGFPDFFSQTSVPGHEDYDIDDEDEQELSEMAGDLLTIFVGSMMGVKVADQGIHEMSKGMAKTAVARLPRLVITKTIVFPIAAQVAKMVGMKLSKEGMAKTLGKLLPIAGGVFSGTLTLFTFKPGARRLQKRLKAQKLYLKDQDNATLSYFWEENGEAQRQQVRSSFAKAEQTQDNPAKKQLALVQVMINMANIYDDLSPDVQDVIEDRLAQTELTGDEQIALLETLGTEYSFDVDYDMLACDSDYVQETLRAMIDVMQAAGRKTMAEKMYLSMVAKTLGVSKEELDALQQKQKTPEQQNS